MACLTCNPSRRLRVGDRVTVSDWEKVWSGRDLRGEIVAVGNPDTLRRGTVKVTWDGYKEEWWPLNALLKEPQAERTE